MSLVAVGEFSNGLRSLCMMSHILKNGPFSVNTGVWGASLKKWRHILKADLKYHDTAKFNKICTVLDSPVVITTD